LASLSDALGSRLASSRASHGERLVKARVAEIRANRGSRVGVVELKGREAAERREIQRL
jgi:hypothetical protein